MMIRQRPTHALCNRALAVALMLVFFARAVEGSVNSSDCADGFFPIDRELLATLGCATRCGGNSTVGHPGLGCHNFAFTTETHALFTWTSHTEGFTVSGDDDIWVFVNNRLAVDLGGIHQPLSQTVLLNAAAGAAFNGMVLFQDYALDIFTAERHTRGSQFKFATNIATLTGGATSPTGCVAPLPQVSVTAFEPSSVDASLVPPLTDPVLVQCVPYNHGTADIPLIAVVRDFASAGSGLLGANPDFQACNGAELGIVASQLGPNSKPMYAPIHGFLPTTRIRKCGGALSGGATTHGLSSFQEWYNRPYSPLWETTSLLRLGYTPNHTSSGFGVMNGPAYVFSNRNANCTYGCSPPIGVMATPPPSSTPPIAESTPPTNSPPGNITPTAPLPPPSAAPTSSSPQDAPPALQAPMGEPVLLPPLPSPPISVSPVGSPPTASNPLAEPPSSPLMQSESPAAPPPLVSPPIAPAPVAEPPNNPTPVGDPPVPEVHAFPNQVPCGLLDPGVRCLDDPCLAAVCTGYPAAICIPNFCRSRLQFLGITTGGACTPMFADPTTGLGIHCNSDAPAGVDPLMPNVSSGERTSAPPGSVSPPQLSLPPPVQTGPPLPSDSPPPPSPKPPIPVLPSVPYAPPLSATLPPTSASPPPSPPSPPPYPPSLPNQVHCGPDDPGVRCLVDPCATATCDGSPGALCFPNYCRSPQAFLGIMTGAPCTAVFADPVTLQGIHCISTLPVVPAVQPTPALPSSPPLSRQPPPPSEKPMSPSPSPPQPGSTPPPPSPSPPLTISSSPPAALSPGPPPPAPQLPNQVQCAPDDPGVRCLMNPCAKATCNGFPTAQCIPTFCQDPRPFLGVMSGEPCTAVFADPITMQGIHCIGSVLVPVVQPRQAVPLSSPLSESPPPPSDNSPPSPIPLQPSSSPLPPPSPILPPPPPSPSPPNPLPNSSPPPHPSPSSAEPQKPQLSPPSPATLQIPILPSVLPPSPSFHPPPIDSDTPKLHPTHPERLPHQKKSDAVP